MPVVFPPYSPSGGGGGVASVNGDVGPAVVLDAADVGAASTAQLAGKVDRPANAPGQSGRLLTFDSTGTVQTVLPSGTAASQGAAVVRTTAGHVILPAAAPTNASWAVNKGYVDTAITTALANVVTSDGTVEEILAKTQAEYDALTPVATTHYLIDG